MKRFVGYGVFLILFFACGSLRGDVRLARLGEEEINMVDVLLFKWTPMIKKKKKDGTLAVMKREELVAGLDEKEKGFIAEIEGLRPETLNVTTPYLGIETDISDLVPITEQVIRKKGETVTLETQYLPRPVYDAYSRMMEAMQKDLGKRLYVESGYRSPAYQIYLFLFYLPSHDYSVLETAKWSALPGFSEHGSFRQQAIDFINEEGENGDDSVEAFEMLQEYRWLTEHAWEYGFVLSYPRNNETGIGFEPWHWHYVGTHGLRPQKEK